VLAAARNAVRRGTPDLRVVPNVGPATPDMRALSREGPAESRPHSVPAGTLREMTDLTDPKVSILAWRAMAAHRSSVKPEFEDGAAASEDAHACHARSVVSVLLGLRRAGQHEVASSGRSGREALGAWGRVCLPRPRLCYPRRLPEGDDAAMTDVAALLGPEADSLLGHACTAIPKASLHLPGPDWVDRIFAPTDRNVRVLGNLQRLLGHGRIGGSGYVSILPVDQGIEHSGGASFAANPAYFDPENIVKLAIEGGCNGVATTLGVLGAVARKYAHKIPFILKFNHNELLTYPNGFQQLKFGSVRQAWDMGCAAVGATIYFGSDDAGREIVEVSSMFEEAHGLGMATILWCYLRNPAFKKAGVDYHVAADLTGQANHLGVTIQADIVKQKLPENNGGFKVLNTEGSYGKFSTKMYDKLATEHPIDLCRYQVANGYMGRIGLINSGGASGSNDLADAVKTAVINKRAGGMGLISGRKAFQKPMADGVAILHAIQDVYADARVTIA
jgi:class I fructose-bisphosphate aldolase